MSQQQTATALAEVLSTLVHQMKTPPTGAAYRVVASWPDGRRWTRRFFTKASALKARESLLNPATRYGDEYVGAYDLAPAWSVEIQVATIGPWAPLEENDQ